MIKKFEIICSECGSKNIEIYVVTVCGESKCIITCQDCNNSIEIADES